MVNARLTLEPAELDRYRGVFAGVPELTVSAGADSRVDIGGRQRPLKILPRLP